MSYIPQDLNSEHTLQLQFEEKNKALKLYYHKEVYLKLKEIYVIATQSKSVKPWNSSVVDLNKLVSEGNSESKSSLLETLNNLVLESMIEPHSDHALLSVIW